MIEDVTGSTARNSRVALSGPNAVAIWQQRLSANEVKILSNYSTDGGVTWHGPQPVSADTWIQRDDASLAMSGRNVIQILCRHDRRTFVTQTPEAPSRDS